MKAILLATTLLAAPLISHAADFDGARIAEHIKVLSSDAYEGRGPATEGEKKAVAYMTEQFKAVGLQPGGDKGADGKRGWTQDVPLAQFDIKGQPVTTVTTKDGVQTWTQGDQIAIRASETAQDHVAVKDAPVVFIGYGVKAPERNWDDFKGVDLKGKIALVLVNDPDFETGKGDFGGKAMTYYGRWTYKYEEAARQGAAGFIVIHETDPASYGWNTVKNSNTITVFDIVRDDPTSVHAPVEAWVQRDPTVALFKAAGLDFEALKAKAQTRDFKPVTLEGVTFSTDFDVDHKVITSHNVVGVVPGAKRPDEYVVYSSHWDHLGVGLPDANGDKIYNGALDNAAGSSGLIELGRAFAKGPKPDRTVVFLSVTAEEKGLLGSEYYAANPVYPLAKTAININMDGLPLNGAYKDVVPVGEGMSNVDDWVKKAAAKQNLVLSHDPRPQAGSFFRSDQFSMAKRGVPAMYAGGGEDLVKGGTAAGKAAADDYVAKRYHQPDDEFDPNWDYGGAIQDLKLQYDVGSTIANSADWPKWNDGAEFKAARDATEDQRK